MRIIKAAKQKDELINTCNTCKSVIGLQEDDITWYHAAWTYTCPVCDAINYFVTDNKSELFPWIMEDEKDDNTISDNHSMREYEV